MNKKLSESLDKSSLEDQAPKFDLKFLLTGRPGTGKTHFCATYTKGPVHFYMFDPGGEKTIRKVARDLDLPLSRFTIDYYNNPQKASFKSFWKSLQKDDHNGFFDKMAQSEGLVVFDSLTKISQLILRDIAKENNRTIATQERPLRIQDWGQVTAWTRDFVSIIDVLPCAVAVTCHYVTETNSEGAVIGEYPSIIGGSRYTIANDFDEVYRLESVGKNYKINFRGNAFFEAKSRVVNETSANNLTMDHLYEAYLHGKSIS